MPDWFTSLGPIEQGVVIGVVVPAALYTLLAVIFAIESAVEAWRQPSPKQLQELHRLYAEGFRKGFGGDRD